MCSLIFIVAVIYGLVLRDFGVGALWGGVLIRYYGNMDLSMPKPTNFVFVSITGNSFYFVEILQLILSAKIIIVTSSKSSEISERYRRLTPYGKVTSMSI